MTSLEKLIALKEGRIDVGLVPASVERLLSDNVLYTTLDERDALSPVIMSSRRDDPSPEIALILRLIKQIHRDEGIIFGR